jgi:NADH-quinone oxidoreductase subunit H
MVGVTFLTLLGHKFWGYIHIRNGPNRVGFVGIFQPSRDTVLFSWEQNFPSVSNYLIYYFLLFFISLLVWLLVPYLRGCVSFESGLFVCLFVLS